MRGKMKRYYADTPDKSLALTVAWDHRPERLDFPMSPEDFGFCRPCLFRSEPLERLGSFQFC